MTSLVDTYEHACMFIIKKPRLRKNTDHLQAALLSLSVCTSIVNLLLADE